MKFTLFAAPLALAVSTVAMPSWEHPHLTRHVSNVTLGNFIANSANGFFPAPGNDGWASAFDIAFAKNVSATFNDGTYTFDQFKAYFSAIKANLEAKYQNFEHSFTSLVAVSAQGGNTGGYVVVTGFEGGLVSGTPVYGTDAAYAVVREINGQLKIVEWHEITNLGAPIA
ncbi:hypothetical protein EXIGLDRAFT_841844 [Exidia glandulosa HHB12029]|uniref:SnoaL-like domain-containing protein n=1 Tax=Exidia glandulosa HHB12029 TaxID=1314781 RepID=A0A165DMW3_EXIGL|nr:hypothetical protein EXIGLDRAFT_841844 [Exidia glandulosa HHB12029]